MLPIPFNSPQTYKGHSGVDYPVGRGTIFRASGHGYVRGVSYSPRGGHYMYVKYDGYPAVGYHHMDSPSPFVTKGTEVWEGSPLGRVGSTGTNSTGPHLHSEVEGYASTSGYWRFFDPNRVVGSAPAGGGTTTQPKPPEPAPIILEDEMIRIQAPNRGIALVGPGYYRHLANTEEVEASASLMSKHVSGNDRQFDLWVSIAMQGNVAGSGSTATVSITDKDATLIASKVKAGPSVEETATAVREKFRTDPLKAS